MQKAVTKKVETVTLKDLAAELVDTHSLPKAQVNTMLTEMVASLGKHLKKGSRIRISGLGILQVRKRAARMGRNPALPSASTVSPVQTTTSDTPTLIDARACLRREPLKTGLF